MKNPATLKKLEVWLTDEPDSDYWYAHTPERGKSANPEIVEKAIKKLYADSQSETLQVDFIGADTDKEHKLVEKLLEIRPDADKSPTKKLNYRIISKDTAGTGIKGIIDSGGLTHRSSLTPMEPADAWWYSVRNNGNGGSNSTKNSNFSYPYRLIVSGETPSIADRVENLMSDNVNSILLIPKLTTKCIQSDGANLKASMNDFAAAFLSGVKEHRILPVHNAKQMLLMIHRFNENDPVVIKNRCNNTDERVLLDVDGSFRPCRHFSVYPKYDLGNADDGVYHKRSLSLHKYGLVIRNGCFKCPARFFCAGPCLSASSVFIEDYIRPMGYHCLFTVLLQEAMEYVYNKLKIEDPDALLRVLEQSELSLKGI